MGDVSTLSTSLEDLRKSFDQSFSIAPEHETAIQEQVLVFTLSQEYYAISLNFIQEVIKVPYITKIPCSPTVIMGIVNLNGEIISISDIHQFFELPKAVITSDSRIIVTKNLPFKTGLLVDTLQSVVAIKKEDIQPPLSTLNTIKTEFIQGNFYVEGKLVIFLNMEELTASSEMEIK